MRVAPVDLCALPCLAVPFHHALHQVGAATVGSDSWGSSWLWISPKRWDSVQAYAHELGHNKWLGHAFNDATGDQYGDW